MGKVEIKFLLDASDLRCLLGVRVGEAAEVRQLHKWTSWEERPGEQLGSSVASQAQTRMLSSGCRVSRGPRMVILWGHFHV